MNEVVNDKLLTESEVCGIVGFSKSSIRAWIKDKKFPEALRIGARASRWRLSDVSAWIAGQQPGASEGKLRGPKGQYQPKKAAPGPVVDEPEVPMRRTKAPGEFKRGPGRPPGVKNRRKASGFVEEVAAA